eukprot:Hpha_TRINITY_DN1411_c0_g2::TRINITY_DN1411_c0_g2_i1::g.9585::m.9585
MPSPAPGQGGAVDAEPKVAVGDSAAPPSPAPGQEGELDAGPKLGVEVEQKVPRAAGEPEAAEPKAGASGQVPPCPSAAGTVAAAAAPVTPPAGASGPIPPCPPAAA